MASADFRWTKAMLAVLAKLIRIRIDFFASDDINIANYGDMSRPPRTRVFTA